MSSRFALKDHFREGRLINDRLIFAALFAGILFIVVMVRLAILQIVEYEHFSSLSNQNRVDIGPLPPQRGLIYDRNGVILAENIPTFSLELTPENVPDLELTLAELAQMFSITDEEIAEIKKRIKRQRRFRQFIFRQRLTEQEVAVFSVNRNRFPGVDVVGRLIRHYPQGALFAHAVGYVGRINERDLKRIDQQDYKGTQQ
ncbi:MAG: penicillin-binding protein 2, partial [Methylophaga sp.]|nr:penicillin-binding protein 2 [Methylophaga sp.]